jgi:diguanylate cyclase (GGDEF)-like protein/PAS domain S-box-containing protein
MINRLRTKKQLIIENNELRHRMAEMAATIHQGQDAHVLAGEAHDYAQSIIETVRESLLVLDANLKIISANLSFYKTFKETPAETVGSFIYELGNRQWDIPGLRTLLQEILPQSRRFDNYEVDHYFPDIGRKVMQLNACRILHEHKGVQTILLAIEDITERKQLEEKLAAIAITDELTGLYNRRGLFVLADKLLKLSKRQGKGIFILYIDLDHLKQINDSMGHEEGDRVLIACADLLREIYRESDIISRIGGDEFVVMPVGSQGDNTDVIISRLHKRLDVFNSCKNHGFILSLSAGVAYCDPQSNASIADLLGNGDKAMYEQKKQNIKIQE